MFSTPYSTNNFASIHSQESKTEQACQFAAKEFKNNLENDSLKYLDGSAFCIKNDISTNKQSAVIFNFNRYCQSPPDFLTFDI